MLGEVLGQLVAGVVAVAHDPVDDARLLEHREVPVDRRLREVGASFEDLGDGERAGRRGEQVDELAATDREALLDPAQPERSDLVEVGDGDGRHRGECTDGGTVPGVDATARFVALVSSATSDVPLDEAALLIAAHVREIDGDAALRELDRLAATCPGTGGGAGFDHLREHLFVAEGFRGAVEHYDDPASSCLDEVLSRRAGIPISLAVVMIEVGRRVGVGVAGVGMPGHFLCADPARPGTYCDPFHGGRRLDEEGCRELYERLHPPTRPFAPAMLAAVPARAILARMLTNLEHGPLAADPARLVRLLEMHVAIPDLAPGDRLALAERFSGVGRFDRAATLVEGIVETVGASDRAALASRARALRARTN